LCIGRDCRGGIIFKEQEGIDVDRLVLRWCVLAFLLRIQLFHHLALALAFEFGSGFIDTMLKKCRCIQVVVCNNDKSTECLEAEGSQQEKGQHMGLAHRAKIGESATWAGKLMAEKKFARENFLGN
jgi:hypothetical protein